MWRPAAPWCPKCGAPEAPEFAYCYRCGAPLHVPAPFSAPVYYPPAAYVPRPPVPHERRRPPGARTRWGLALTAVAGIVFCLPFVSVAGAVLLSIGSTALFVERGSFRAAHRSAMVASYALFWVAAIGYAISIGVFLWAAYDAWLAQEAMSSLLTVTVNFTVVSTLPTSFLIVALALQIRFLLPPKLRWLAYWAVVALIALALAATYLALEYVPGGLGDTAIHVPDVLGVLNAVGLYRVVEFPGFLGLAYLYARAYGNVVSPRRAPAAPASERQG